jgi:hypothetical protein
MNELNVERAYDAFSRFEDEHPNLDQQDYTAEVLRITKRFGLTSVLPIIERCKEEREAVQAQCEALEAALSNPHQAAVNSLLELTMAGAWPDTPVVVPFDQVPALFRAVVEQDKVAGSRNPYPSETDLIEYALMLIDRNGGDANIRTPEQEEFYSALLLGFVDGQHRVSYSPSNVTIH